MGPRPPREALARAGFDVYGVDRDLAALRSAVARSVRPACAIKAWCADLTAGRLPDRRSTSCSSPYLQRDLVPSLTRGGPAWRRSWSMRRSLRDQIALGRGPTSPDHLLVPGELRSFSSGSSWSSTKRSTIPRRWRGWWHAGGVGREPSNAAWGSDTLPGAAGPCERRHGSRSPRSRALQSRSAICKYVRGRAASCRLWYTSIASRPAAAKPAIHSSW